MNASFQERFFAATKDVDLSQPERVPVIVEALLELARECQASDLHLTPTLDAVEARLRVDGVLQPLAVLPRPIQPNLVGRLKVLAELLTYRSDVPQEGRIGRALAGTNVEMRVSTFPSIHGEKVVVRLLPMARRLERLADLGLPEEIDAALSSLLDETSGALVFAGPAGSGKTTTAYACLREIADRTDGTRSISTLEDPVEAVLAGVTQSQVHEPSGFDLATGLRSLMRQDPEVIFVGEIRDRSTAELALQAVLTGHLLLTTFHAGSAAGAVSRLCDMGIEPYILRSSIRSIVCQRLVRRLCACGRSSEKKEEFLGLAVDRCRVPVGCASCGGTGYRGRGLLAEMLVPGAPALAEDILARRETAALETSAVAAGMTTRWERARRAVQAGWTSPAEIRRVLGWPDRSEPSAGAPGKAR